MDNQYTEVLNEPFKSSKNVTIDLAARYASSFGINSLGDLINKALVVKKLEEDSNEYDFEYFPKQATNIEYVKMSIQNLDPLEFSSVLKDDAGAIFAPPLMMTFSQEKSLIETEVNDDDPIIVERWGTKPWKISIKGLLIALENRIYPTEEIKKLNKNWQQNAIVSVEGRQFEELGIDSIYFNSIDFSKSEGFQDTVQFSISATSIKPVSFTLGKPKATVWTEDLTVLGISEDD
jgi:hypothetical protein